MEKVIEYINLHAKERESVFVFPTAAESREWYINSLEITGLTAIPEDKFLSWDIFKERFFTSSVSAKIAINQVMRKIFAKDILRQNKLAFEKTVSGADSGASSGAADGAIFKHIIPETCAKNSENFASWVLGVLPQLDNLARKMQTHSYETELLKEFLLLKQYYEKFLEKHNLYEPSWNPTKMLSQDKKITIFFPELIEDFYEMTKALAEEPSISYIYTDSLSAKCMQAVEFENSRMEIEACVSKVQGLLEKKARPDSIAITVCNLEELKPYIEREAHLRNIPISFRVGEKLGNTQVGALFSKLTNLVSSGFGFSAMQTLFTNAHFPWKNSELIFQLLDFGREFCCVASWEENGLTKNVWEEAFRALESGKTKSQYECEQFFILFKTDIEKMVGAKTFENLLDAYIKFSTDFFEKDEFSIQDDLVLASCVEKLKALCLLETEFSQEIPADRFAFFTEILSDTIYVQPSIEGAVSVFPFQVMAISPFEYNFLLNAGQREVKAVFSHLSFLRDDIRESLDSFDVDAAKAFLRCYCNNRNAVVSYSLKTFTDYAIRHASLSKMQVDENQFKFDSERVNLFLREEAFLKGEIDSVTELYQSQKNGLNNFFQVFSQEPKYSFLTKKMPQRLQAQITDELKLRNYLAGENVMVSQAQLNDFNKCRTAFFLKRILKLSKIEKPTLIASLDLGSVSHEIIKEIFDIIMRTFGKINDRAIAEVRENLHEIILQKINRATSISVAFKRFLFEKKLNEILALLDYLLENYEGFSIPIIETKLQKQGENYLLEGTVDCALYDKLNDAYDLFDFKSNWVSKATDVRVWNETHSISNFQIAMYVLLLEANAKSSKVENAFLWSLDKKNAVKVVGKMPRAQKDYSRMQFDMTLDLLMRVVDNFVKDVKEMNFTKSEGVNFENCYACEYKQICRTTFQMEVE